MKSPFNPDYQNNEIDSKIVVALERLSGAFRALLWNESKQNALSPIQIQILIFLLFHPGEKCKVSYLAQEFNMTRPTISDSIRSLLEKDLIKKYEAPLDIRSYTIGLTGAGKRAATKSAGFALAVEEPLSFIPGEQKEAMLTGLLKIIYELNRAGIITIQRMCFTCSNYSVVNDYHYCKLLQARLANNELRVDCKEHEPKVKPS